jgi:hypothetical protein
MSQSKSATAEPPVSGRPVNAPGRRRVVWAVLAVSIAVAVAATIVGFRTDPQSFARTLSEFLLQGALLTTVGGIITALIKQDFDEAAGRREEEGKRREEERETRSRQAAERREFLRRMADVHSEIEHASRLMRAHDSVETYLEQTRHLMLKISTLWEIHQDLTIADDLFGSDAETIRNNIMRIIDFLEDGAQEYVRVYRRLNPDSAAGPSLRTMIEQDSGQFPWVRGFVCEAHVHELPATYRNALDRSKGLMRQRVFASTSGN